MQRPQQPNADARPLITNRRDSSQIAILRNIDPGVTSNGCCVCCHAPACCPACSSCCLCVGDADYVVQKREASKYILIRENSLEYNSPEIVMSSGGCCALDPCLFVVQDNVHVVYFDDPIMDSLSTNTRCCNECRSCLCGGQGERIRMDATCCCGFCYRSTKPCPFVPVCCPGTCCPTAIVREIYVKDCHHALYEIKKARKEALEGNNKSQLCLSPQDVEPKIV